MYYTGRQGVSGDLYKNSDDGGAEVGIVLNSINWPGHPFFNPDDGFIYVPYDNAVRRYTDAGVLDFTYPTLTQAHTVVVDATNVMAGSWNNAGHWYIPIAGGSWINGDAFANIWQTELSADRTIVYGSAFNIDTLVQWASLPPPLAANRTTIDSGLAYNTIHSVTRFDIGGAGGGGGVAINQQPGTTIKNTLGI